jgi:hypothetical protein
VTPRNPTQTTGGDARARGRSQNDRSAISREAALTLGAKTHPRAVASGSLKIGSITLSCAVLDNNVRVLTQGAIRHAVGFGRSRSPKAGTRVTADGVPTFLRSDNLDSYIDDEVVRYSSPIRYRTELGTLSHGYDAMLLTKVCLVYIRARDDKALRASQYHIARRASMILRSLGEDDIAALVDEATGFHQQQARDELIEMLARYTAPELLPWTKRFPNEFFAQIFRLQDRPYRRGAIKRTPYVARWIYKYIYEQLPPAVLDKLREPGPVINDRAYRRYSYHPFLSVDTGDPHLDHQIAVVLILMRISTTVDEFERIFAKALDAARYERRPLVVDVQTDQPSRTGISIDRT